MLGRQHLQRGDTLIEVLFAVTVFSMIVVGALALMNQGVATSTRSLETTISRQAMDGQAEALRFMHEAYVSEYQSGATYNTSDTATSPAEEYYRIIQNAKANPAVSATTLTGTTCPTSAPSGSFVVDPVTARIVTGAAQLRPADLYPQLEYNGAGVFTVSKGLWVETVRSATAPGGSPTSNAGYIDFHIRACWMSLGSKVPVTLGTIVRLYEPRG